MVIHLEFFLLYHHPVVPGGLKHKNRNNSLLAESLVPKTYHTNRQTDPRGLNEPTPSLNCVLLDQLRVISMPKVRSDSSLIAYVMGRHVAVVMASTVKVLRISAALVAYNQTITS